MVRWRNVLGRRPRRKAILATTLGQLLIDVGERCGDQHYVSLGKYFLRYDVVRSMRANYRRRRRYW